MVLRKFLCLLLLCPGLVVFAAPPDPGIRQLKADQVMVNPAQVDFIAFVDSGTLMVSSYEAEWKPDPNDAKKKVHVTSGDHRLWSLGKDEPIWRLPRTLPDRPVVIDGKAVLIDGEVPEGQGMAPKGLNLRILDAATGKEEHRIEVTSRGWTMFGAPGLNAVPNHGVTLDGMKVELTADKIDLGKTKPKPFTSQTVTTPVLHAPDGKGIVVSVSRPMIPPGLPVNRVDPFYSSIVHMHLADANGRVSVRLPLGAGVDWAGGAYSSDSKKLAIALDSANLGIPGSLDPKQVTAQIKDREDRERRNYEQLVKIMICDARTGKELARFGKAGVSVMAFSPDGRYLAATGRVKSRFTPNPDPKKNGGTSLGPEKEAPAKAGVIQLWDITTRKQIAELVGHEKGVTVLAFSASGSHLASGGEDKTVRIWDLSKVSDTQAK